jgi:hypothetical protein
MKLNKKSLKNYSTLPDLVLYFKDNLFEINIYKLKKRKMEMLKSSITKNLAIIIIKKINLVSEMPLSKIKIIILSRKIRIT